MKRQIIALGGGGFSMEPHNPLLDQYILKQSAKVTPKVCFIPTASGDAQGYIDKFYESAKGWRCKPSHLSLFKGSTPNIEKFILKQDILYVGGGNTRNLLTLWREWGVDQLIRKAYEQGTVLAGISAGSICWFEQGLTDSVPRSLTSLNCLGWLKGSNSPHYDGEAQRRPRYQELIKAGEIRPGLALDDGVGAHYINEELAGLVSSHPEKRAYRVSLRDGEPNEEALVPNYLGGGSLLIRRAAECDAEGIHRSHMRSIQEICSKDHSAEEIIAWGHRDYNEETQVAGIRRGRIWVVEDRGVIQGHGYLRIYKTDEANQARIGALYLTPEVTGKGLGQAIVAMMLEECRAEKVKHVELQSSITARGFYKKIGFGEVGPEESVEINGVGIRCYHMEMGL